MLVFTTFSPYWKLMYSYTHKEHIHCGHSFELVRRRKGQDLEQTNDQEFADVNEAAGLLGRQHRDCTTDLSINPRNSTAISSGKRCFLACLPRGKS